MDLFIERRAFVRGNGDVDEFMTLVIANNGSVPFDLQRVWLNIPVTDARADVLAVSDGRPGNPEWWANEVDERFLVTLHPRGEVPPHGTRIVGVHVLCRERCTVEDDRITFRDPCLLGDLRVLAPERIATIATVNFPPDDRMRGVRAPGAIWVTSRTATWEFRPSEGQPEQLYACLEASPCGTAVAMLDDGLAALHELIGRDACGDAWDVETALAPLRRTFAGRDIAVPSSLAALNDLERSALLTRQHALRRALQDCGRQVSRQSLSRNESMSATIFGKRSTDRGTENDLYPDSTESEANHEHVDVTIGSQPETVIRLGGDAELRVRLDAPSSATVRSEPRRSVHSSATESAGPISKAFVASDDCSEFHWRDQVFHFNRRQASAVRYLLRSYEKKASELHEHSIEDHVGWRHGPLGQNFHGHPAWGTLIVKGTAPGTYRLDL